MDNLNILFFHLLVIKRLQTVYLRQLDIHCAERIRWEWLLDGDTLHRSTIDWKPFISLAWPCRLIRRFTFITNHCHLVISSTSLASSRKGSHYGICHRATKCGVAATISLLPTRRCSKACEYSPNRSPSILAFNTNCLQSGASISVILPPWNGPDAREKRR